jgi:hypothetical protein
MGMTVLPEGLPDISVYGTESGPRMDVAIDRSGEPGIAFYGPNGTARMTVGIIPTGEPHINLADSRGFRVDLGTTNLVKPATGATEETSAASLVMFGKDGKVLWSAP